MGLIFSLAGRYGVVEKYDRCLNGTCARSKGAGSTPSLHARIDSARQLLHIQNLGGLRKFEIWIRKSLYEISRDPSSVGLEHQVGSGLEFDCECLEQL